MSELRNYILGDAGVKWMLERLEKISQAEFKASFDSLPVEKKREVIGRVEKEYRDFHKVGK